MCFFLCERVRLLLIALPREMCVGVCVNVQAVIPVNKDCCVNLL